MKERPNLALRAFGSQLRAWRISERLSLRDLADLLHIADVQLTCIEQGRDSGDIAASWPHIVADLRKLGFG